MKTNNFDLTIWKDNFSSNILVANANPVQKLAESIQGIRVLFRSPLPNDVFPKILVAKRVQLQKEKKKKRKKKKRKKN
jgi:hypothetical protein